MTPRSIPAGPGLTLDADQVADLARLLEVIEDWLRHAGHDTRVDLAEFLNGAGHGPLAAAGLIATLGQTTLTLHRHLTPETRR
jgi:hypothetical protein